MYQYIDRSVQSLDFTNRFLVWAMRQWVDANTKGQCACGDLGPVFDRWGLSKALPDFFMMMAHLNMGAKEQFIFGQITCGNVHEIEAFMLSLQREILADRAEDCQATAEQLLAKTSVPGFITALQRYCDHVEGSALNLAKFPVTNTKYGLN